MRLVLVPKRGPQLEATQEQIQKRRVLMELMSAEVPVVGQVVGALEFLFVQALPLWLVVPI